MAQVLSMRYRPGQEERLGKIARRMGRTPSEMGVLLLEEALRRAEFGGIDFRESTVGRQAYVLGSSLAVWEVVSIAGHYDMDAQKTGAHLSWPVFRVQAAINYASAFPEEIDAAVSDNRGYDFLTVSRLLPQATDFVTPDDETER